MTHSDDSSDNRSARGYDALAPIYQALETCLFGRTLQRARVALLDRLPESKTALVLGDGNGRFLEQLCLAQTHCLVTSVDQSEGMLQAQRKRVARVHAEDRVLFLCRDARTFQPQTESFELITCPFFLDCFTQQELVDCLPKWISGLRPGGHFYFVDFIKPESGWRHHQAAVYEPLMHWFFRWQTELPNQKLVDFDSVFDTVFDQQNLSLIESTNDVHPMIACRMYCKG